MPYYHALFQLDQNYQNRSASKMVNSHSKLKSRDNDTKRCLYCPLTRAAHASDSCRANRTGNAPGVSAGGKGCRKGKKNKRSAQPKKSALERAREEMEGMTEVTLASHVKLVPLTCVPFSYRDWAGGVVTITRITDAGYRLKPEHYSK